MTGGHEFDYDAHGRRIAEKITAKEFGFRIAKAMNQIRSSHVFFVVQQAFPDKDLEWEDVQKMLDSILLEEKLSIERAKPSCPEPHFEGKVPLRRGGYEVGDAAYGP